MYKVYRKEFGKRICLCSQSFEDKELFKNICKNSNYEIYFDNKNISNKYRQNKKKEKFNDD